MATYPTISPWQVNNIFVNNNFPIYQSNFGAGFSYDDDLSAMLYLLQTKNVEYKTETYCTYPSFPSMNPYDVPINTSVSYRYVAQLECDANALFLFAKEFMNAKREEAFREANPGLKEAYDAYKTQLKLMQDLV